MYGQKYSNCGGCKTCILKSGGACSVRSCSYEINCQCGDSYIGETGCSLKYPFNEHLSSLRTSYADGPLAKHGIHNHHGNVLETRMSIITVSNKSLDAKSQEQFLLESIGQPSIHRELFKLVNCKG